MGKIAAIIMLAAFGAFLYLIHREGRRQGMVRRRLHQFYHYESPNHDSRSKESMRREDMRVIADEAVRDASTRWAFWGVLAALFLLGLDSL